MMKIGIIGAGQVGSTTAFALLMRNVGSEIVLVDLDEGLLEAQAEDLNHAGPFSHPIIIRYGKMERLEGCGIVILSAGVSQKPGESRIALLDRNANVFKTIVPQVVKYAPDAIIIVATNPVDIMTLVTERLAKDTPRGRIFGSGTILDTARFESFLAQHLGVSSTSVDAFVLGEHGDSKVLHWSGATTGTIPVRDLADQLGRPLSQDIRREMDERVRTAADRIIKGKGSTYYGIAAALARLCEAIINDQTEVFTVTMSVQAQHDTYEEIEGTAVSLPRIVGAKGVEATFVPDLTPIEYQALEESSMLLRRQTEAMEMDLTPSPRNNKKADGKLNSTASSGSLEYTAL